ncbi:uncharacterized protein BDV17DRAFT_266712 [Aspergillus undulatus]|uniref:uncharacterized protein n=1 Tax=Aspergillus undulatus TaxID=1810928 RepID=UPI003CCD85A2
MMGFSHDFLSYAKGYIQRYSCKPVAGQLSAGDFDKLPPELVEQVTSYLDYCSARTLRRTCKYVSNARFDTSHRHFLLRSIRISRRDP